MKYTKYTVVASINIGVGLGARSEMRLIHEDAEDPRLARERGLDIMARKVEKETGRMVEIIGAVVLPGHIQEVKL